MDTEELENSSLMGLPESVWYIGEKSEAEV